MKPQATEKKYGAELASIECTNTKLQLADKEMVIGDDTWKALNALQGRKTEEINAWNEIILQYCYFIPAAEVAPE